VARLLGQFLLSVPDALDGPSAYLKAGGQGSLTLMDAVNHDQWTDENVVRDMVELSDLKVGGFG
jgi:hypothetical protein